MTRQPSIIEMALYLQSPLVMIQMSLRLTPPPERLDEVIDAFRLLAARTEVRPGCRQSWVEEDPHKHGAVFYHEKWSSWAEMEKRVRSNTFLQILQLIEISVCAPVLNFEGPNKRCGMEFVHALRKNSATP